MDKLNELNTILKGGSGSGDWGHVGRAGKRGGSGGGGGKGKSRRGRRSREALNKEIEAGKKPRAPKSLKDTDLTRVDDFDYTPGMFESYVVKTSDGSVAMAKPYTDSTKGREVGAYRLAQSVGYDAIPETAEREIDGKLHSVQKWVHEETATNLANEGIYDPDMDSYKKQLIFDIVTGQEDRHGENYLVDDDGKITSIDNGAIGGYFEGIGFGVEVWKRDPVGMFESQIDEQLDFSDHLNNGGEYPSFKKSDFDFILNNESKFVAEMERMNLESLPGFDPSMSNFRAVLKGMKEYVDSL